MNSKNNNAIAPKESNFPSTLILSLKTRNGSSCNNCIIDGIAWYTLYITNDLCMQNHSGSMVYFPPELLVMAWSIRLSLPLLKSPPFLCYYQNRLVKRNAFGQPQKVPSPNTYYKICSANRFRFHSAKPKAFLNFR